MKHIDSGNPKNGLDVNSQSLNTVIVPNEHVKGIKNSANNSTSSDEGLKKSDSSDSSLFLGDSLKTSIDSMEMSMFPDDSLKKSHSLEKTSQSDDSLRAAKVDSLSPRNTRPDKLDETRKNRSDLLQRELSFAILRNEKRFTF